MVSRRAHRHDTLVRLDQAAVALFAERGSGVTVAEIADRAGLSRRTVFRYVEHKEELVFIHPLLWFDVFNDGLEQAPPSPLAERLRRASRRIAEHIDADPEPPRQAFLVVAQHPELARGYTRIFGLWIDRVATEVLASLDGEPTRAQRFRARVVGSSIMGMVDAVTREWLLDPEASFVELYDDAWRLVEPVLGSDLDETS